MSRIVIKDSEKQHMIIAQDGETLLAALRREGYSIPAACAGRGRCGKCRVLVNGTARLSCKVIPADGDEVILPDSSGGRILTDTIEIPPLKEEEFSEGCAAAFDLGTTTIALRLYDLSSGAELSTLSEWNRQGSYGGDVISRMEYTLSSPEHLQELSKLIHNQCDFILQSALKKCNKTDADLLRTVISGNTIMQHIYAAYPLDTLATAPFTPYSLFKDHQAEENLLYYMPCISGYVGGDITAGIFASGLPEKEGNYLFLDIGTNGEMALGGKDGFLSCAVASGPAFEGAGISCGMAGINGAISHVRYDHGFLYDVIGNGSPKGFCGSGLIDLVAELRRTGCIDSSGRLLPPEDIPESMKKYFEKDSDGNGIFHFNKKISLTARDVRNMQLAKAAVAGGIKVLLSQRNLMVKELDGIYLAGGFGTYIDTKNAVKIGMLPDVSPEKFHVIGNASLAGASMLALHPQYRELILKIVDKIEYIELSGRNDFAEAFAEGMSF